MKKNKLVKTLLSSAVMGLCLVSVTSCKEDKPDEDKPEVVVPEKKYTITFDSKGGTDVAKITDIESGKTANKPEDPTKDGFKFVGWFTDKYFNFQFDFSRDKIKGDWTLYAKWEENALTKAKNTAKEALDAYVAKLKEDGATYVGNQDILDAEIANEKTKISDATTEELVTTALEAAKTAISAIKNDVAILALKTDDAALDELATYMKTTYPDYVKTLVRDRGEGEEALNEAITVQVKYLIIDYIAPNELAIINDQSITDPKKIVEAFNQAKENVDLFIPIGIANFEIEDVFYNSPIYEDENHVLHEAYWNVMYYMNYEFEAAESFKEYGPIIEEGKTELELFIDADELMTAKLIAKYDFIGYALDIMSDLNDNEENVDTDEYFNLLYSDSVRELGRRELAIKFINKVDELSADIIKNNDAASLESAKNAAIEEFKPLCIIMIIDFTDSAIEAYYKAEIDDLELSAEKTTETNVALEAEIKEGLEDFRKVENFKDFHEKFTLVKQTIDTFILDLKSTESVGTN